MTKTLIPQREHFAGAELLSPVWALTKGPKTARCEVWSHQFGFELRYLVGRELVSSMVVRSHKELVDVCLKWKDALTEKGWT